MPPQHTHTHMYSSAACRSAVWSSSSGGRGGVDYLLDRHLCGAGEHHGYEEIPGRLHSYFPPALAL